MIVTEKLDGSNVGILKLNGQIFALNRSGYRAETSPYEQHQLFAAWVRDRAEVFDQHLNEGDRLVGEWLLQAHGTRYSLPHEPFAGFDWFAPEHRLPYEQFQERVRPLQAQLDIGIPYCLHFGKPIDVPAILESLEPHGHHGAIDLAEGAVWRVETDRGSAGWQVDFLAKYVRSSKVEGCYLPGLSDYTEPTWNQVKLPTLEV